MTEDRLDNRRKSNRVPFMQEVEIVGVGMRRCSDISVGGIYLDTVSIFAENEILTLRLKLPGADPRAIEVRARVRYVHPSVGVGLEFLDLRPEDRERIEKLIHS